MIDDAERLATRQAPAVAGILRRVYTLLVDDLGCSAYVKTIYVGFTLDGAMVAAAYPRSETVEVALAMEEGHESVLLKDASHLTWPTLPLFVTIETDALTSEIEELLRQAHRRVKEQEHKVDRPPAFFYERK